MHLSTTSKQKYKGKSSGLSESSTRTNSRLPHAYIGEDRGISLFIQHDALQTLHCHTSITFLDGNNSFNPYFLADVCRIYHMNPEQTLSRLTISRNFTAHQLTRGILQLNRRDGFPIYILGFLHLFGDEQMANHEAWHLFKQCIVKLSDLQASRSVTLSVNKAYVVSDRTKRMLHAITRQFKTIPASTDNMLPQLAHKEYIHMHYS